MRQRACAYDPQEEWQALPLKLAAMAFSRICLLSAYLRVVSHDQSRLWLNFWLFPPAIASPDHLGA